MKIIDDYNVPKTQ